jgi:IclR family transcriptional regulator, pca regulon regulatory protein
MAAPSLTESLVVPPPPLGSDSRQPTPPRRSARSRRRRDPTRPHPSTTVANSAGRILPRCIVYTARVAVPKIIALSVTIGTRFPAVAASMGHVLLADLTPAELSATLETASRSGVIPRVEPTRAELDDTLAAVRARGWALADQVLSLGIRSIAAPVRNGHGRVIAALNVTVHAAETSVERLLGDHLPRLLEASSSVADELHHLDRLPLSDVTT